MHDKQFETAYDRTGFEHLEEPDDMLQFQLKKTTTSPQEVVVTKNAAICYLCDETVESIDPDKSVSCKCGNVVLSGGTLYPHARVKNLDAYAPMIEISDNLMSIPATKSDVVEDYPVEEDTWG